jgi:hypothetical protein
MRRGAVMNLRMRGSSTLMVAFARVWLARTAKVSNAVWPSDGGRESLAVTVIGDPNSFGGGACRLTAPERSLAAHATANPAKPMTTASRREAGFVTDSFFPG